MVVECSSIVFVRYNPGGPYAEMRTPSCLQLKCGYGVVMVALLVKNFESAWRLKSRRTG